MDNIIAIERPSVTQLIGLHEKLSENEVISEVFDVDGSSFPDDFTIRQYKYAYALLYNNNYDKLSDLLDYIGWKRK